ncbi:MAG: 4-hydroxy-tetrahydrodipicolinate synthase [Pseudomonadota bacterium]
MFSGAIVAIVTPFKDGRVDEQAYRGLIEWQIESGTSAIVPCGTTGESPTLSFEEHKRVVETCVDQVKGRVPVIAGTGGNSTAEAVELTEHARQAGAAASLQVVPYYNKPSQEGLYRHFSRVAEVGLPLILYNIPGRTGVNMLPDTVARLSREQKNIVGIKEASGNLQQMAEVIASCPRKNFALLSGDDTIVLPVMAIGGRGVISVVSNVAPRLMSDLCASYLSGDHAKARDLYYRMLPLALAMFYETNPVPVKTALGLMGKCGPECRLPLAPMAEKNKERLAGVLRQQKLI